VDKITVLIGSVVGGSSGQVNDDTRKVEFVGEEVATRTEWGISDKTGGIIDTRGVDETLYKTDDDRLVVHVKDWSYWQGEPTVYSIHEVTKNDLCVDGRYAALGAEAGYGRPLTLDEAVSAPL